VDWVGSGESRYELAGADSEALHESLRLTLREALAVTRSVATLTQSQGYEALGVGYAMSLRELEQRMGKTSVSALAEQFLHSGSERPQPQSNELRDLKADFGRLADQAVIVKAVPDRP
jgi:hypothetical protein